MYKGMWVVIYNFIQISKYSQSANSAEPDQTPCSAIHVQFKGHKYNRLSDVCNLMTVDYFMSQ